MDTPWRRAKRSLHAKLVRPILSSLEKGADVHRVADSLAVGFCIGLFPVFGASTGLCVLAAMLFKKRLNMTLLVLSNLVAAPFTLAMFVPFMRVGEMLTGSSAFPLSVEKIRSLVWSSPGKIVGALFHSMAGWFIVCPFVAFVLIRILTPVLQYARAKLPNNDKRTPTSQEV
mmetsp:Transcript_11044/g.68090  ORF Transcript_11044/g.68090 Transcript_11044/m.68090 type:complete len:172 (-) Transcript_11044:1624-2139(-)